jgi:hypothetical protein
MNAYYDFFWTYMMKNPGETIGQAAFNSMKKWSPDTAYDVKGRPGLDPSRSDNPEVLENFFNHTKRILG